MKLSLDMFHCRFMIATVIGLLHMIVQQYFEVTRNQSYLLTLSRIREETLQNTIFKNFVNSTWSKGKLSSY